MSFSKNSKEFREQVKRKVRSSLKSVSDLDEEVKEAIAEVIDFMGKRPLLGLATLLENHPQWTSGRLIKANYDHSPRVFGDLKDFGVPILAENMLGQNGERSHHYRLGSKEDIVRRPLKGRSTLRKKIKRELLAKFGCKDSLTEIEFPETSLQIDHRIPFRVSGDDPANLMVERFMLLSASSQRAKAMACKRCRNMENAIQETCKTCYWASPEDYTHVEGTEAKVTTVIWHGDDKDLFSLLKQQATLNNKDLAEEIKATLRAVGARLQPA